MACQTIGMIFTRVIVIAAIGLGAGLVDSVRRPIKTGGRLAPPPVSGSATSPSAPASNQGSHPAPVTDAGADGKKPGDSGWKPTDKAAMPAGQITLDEAKKLFDASAPFVDARRKEDYEQGHIKGAMRINLKSFENGDPPLLAMIPRDADVVVYCSGGNCDESEHVAEFLSNSGYKKVYVIHDGFPGWKAQGWPVEIGEGIQ